MTKYLLILLLAGVAHAEMPKPQPQKWPNNHEYIVELNGKETAIMIYRRVGTYGQLYEVRSPRMTNIITGYDPYYLYDFKPMFVDLSKTKIIREIHAKSKNPEFDFVDPDTTPKKIQFYRMKAGVE
jgi:hypothetical protein